MRAGTREIVAKQTGGPPLSEAEYYFKCEVCGGYFDMRDFGPVLDHDRCTFGMGPAVLHCWKANQDRCEGRRPGCRCYRSGRGAGGAAFGAADCGVGLTPHQAVIQRAIAAVETVNQRMADLQKTGGMRDMNDEFKQARKAETVVRYQDFLHAKKMAMLKELPGDAAAAAASLRQVANGHRWRYLPAMDWNGAGLFEREFHG
jgi:hypothetical protein